LFRREAFTVTFCSMAPFLYPPFVTPG
jgi:hypothetical protein